MKVCGAEGGGDDGDAIDDVDGDVVVDFVTSSSSLTDSLMELRFVMKMRAEEWTLMMMSPWWLSRAHRR